MSTIQAKSESLIERAEKNSFFSKITSKQRGSWSKKWLSGFHHDYCSTHEMEKDCSYNGIADKAHRGRVTNPASISMDFIPDLVTIHNRMGDVVEANTVIHQWFLQKDQTDIEKDYCARILVTDRPLFLKALSDTFYKNRSALIRVRLRFADEEISGQGCAAPLNESFQWVEVHMQSISPTQQGSDDSLTLCVTRRIDHFIKDIAIQEKRNSELADLASLRDSSTTLAYREMQTPLQAIQGYAQLLATDILAFSSDQRQDYARRIYDAAQCALTISSQMSENLPSLVGTASFDLGILILDCCHMVQHQASKKGVFIAREITTDTAFVTLDENYCRQIILSLLTHRIKMAKKGDRIALKLDTRMTEPESIQFILYMTGLSAKDHFHSPLGRQGKAESFSIQSDIHPMHNNYDIVMAHRRLHNIGGELWVEQTDQTYTSFSILWPKIIKARPVIHVCDKSRQQSLITDMETEKKTNCDVILNQELSVQNQIKDGGMKNCA